MRQVSGGWADGGAGAQKGSDARNLVNFLSRGWRRQVAGQHHDNQLLPAGPELHVLLALAGLYIICCLIEMRVENQNAVMFTFYNVCIFIQVRKGPLKGPPT
jgi:hypothetical protein